MIIVGLEKKIEKQLLLIWKKFSAAFPVICFFPVSFFRSREYFRISVCDDRIFGHRTFSGKS